MRITSEHDLLPADKHLDWQFKNDGRIVSTKFSFYWRDRPAPALTHVEVFELPSGGRSRHQEWSAELVDTATGIRIGNCCFSHFTGGGARFVSKTAAIEAARTAITAWRKNNDTPLVHMSPIAAQRIERHNARTTT